MRRIIIALVVFGGLWVYNGGLSDLTGGGSDAPTGDPVTSFSDGDAEMNAAMAAANASLPAFLANNTSTDGASLNNTGVKVAFETTNDGNEIIWVNPFEWDGGTQMSGLLSNQPNYLGDLNVGDRVEFTTDMVRDWSLITPDGKMWGNFTTRVMIPMLDEETATALGAMLSDDPVPADWN